MRGFSLGRSRARSSFAVLVSALALASTAALPTAAAARRHGPRAAGGSCPYAGTAANRAAASAMRAAAVCLINRERAVRGLPALHASRRLNRSAQGWTNAMVGGDFFSHGANFAGRISAVGFNWSSAGENIAAGYATPRAVVNGWMASTGHCENILNPRFREVGTGVRWQGLRRFGVGPAAWTEDFALAMGQRGMSGNYGPMHGCPY
jgi:uncharacterized protein YkwD